MEYCFHPDQGTVGAQMTCHPLWVVGSYFHKMGMARELEWCRRAKDMDMDGDGSGLRKGARRRRVELMWLGEGSGAWRW
jgi:hypothetical protein